jgi:hypothetical protein
MVKAVNPTLNLVCLSPNLKIFDGRKFMLLQEQENCLRQVIAKAWSDPLFKERLKSDPKSVLADMGFKPPEGIEIEVVENTTKKMFLALPVSPVLDIGTDDNLEAIVTVGGQPMDIYTQHTPHSCATNNLGCC